MPVDTPASWGAFAWPRFATKSAEPSRSLARGAYQLSWSAQVLNNFTAQYTKIDETFVDCAAAAKKHSITSSARARSVLPGSQLLCISRRGLTDLAARLVSCDIDQRNRVPLLVVSAARIVGHLFPIGATVRDCGLTASLRAFQSSALNRRSRWLRARAGRKEDAGSQGRVGADDVERVVVETLSRQLSRPKLMNELTSGIWSIEPGYLCEMPSKGSFSTTVRYRSSAMHVIRRVRRAKVHAVRVLTPQPSARKEIIIPDGREDTTPLSHSRHGDKATPRKRPVFARVSRPETKTVQKTIT
jgi:hypothetical protein